MRDSVVSIIIINHNGEEWIRESIESALGQDSDWNVEVVCVDDCSSDRSWEIIKGYEGFEVKTLRLSENRGRCVARNAGAAVASGDYIVFLDCDDKLPPHYVQMCMETAMTSGAGVVYSDSHYFEEVLDVKVWPEYDEGYLKQENFINVSAMVSKGLFNMVGGFDECMRYGLEDWDLWIRLAKQGVMFKKCPDTYLLYRQHSEGMSIKDDFKYDWNIKYLREKHKGWIKV